MEADKKIPGYTGYRPQYEHDDVLVNPSSTRDNRFYVPGKNFN